jgi:hypothetical protein
MTISPNTQAETIDKTGAIVVSALGGSVKRLYGRKGQPGSDE